MSKIIEETVDVIIPVYNASKFIRQTIESVLEQTLLPSKIIIVDDGSTDNSVDIIKSFNNDLIELICLSHSGVSRARNIGIKSSKAKYIAFLDSDDLWLSTKLEAQVNKLSNNLAAGVCYSGAKLIDENGIEISNSYGRPYIKGRVFEDLVYYERPIYGSASSVIVVRDILLQTRLFDETMAFSEDVDLWAQLSLITEFDYVESAHVKIRVHSKSATRDKNWDKSVKILLQHFYYINKFANTHNLPKTILLVHKRRIIRLFFNYPKNIWKITTFFYLLKAYCPYLLSQMQYKKPIHLIRNLLRISIYEALRRAFKLGRLRLLFTQGTIFFSKSKEYIPDVECIRKKR